MRFELLEQREMLAPLSLGSPIPKASHVPRYGLMAKASPEARQQHSLPPQPANLLCTAAYPQTCIAVPDWILSVLAANRN